MLYTVRLKRPVLGQQQIRVHAPTAQDALKRAKQFDPASARAGR